MGKQITAPVMLGYGQAYTHKLGTGLERAGTNYPVVTLEQIVTLVAEPQNVDKHDGMWIIPSDYAGYDGRRHTVQQELGAFWYLSVDVDEGDHTKEDVATAVGAVLGDAAFILFATKSSMDPAKGGGKRWRILVPLETPVAGAVYKYVVLALRTMLASVGGLAPVDQTSARFGQISYLPNRGPYHYDYMLGGRAATKVSDHPDLVWQSEQEYLGDATAGGSTYDGSGKQMWTPIWNFCRAYPVEELLATYGYTLTENGQWRHPEQESLVGSLMVYEDEGWSSFSGTMVEQRIGRYNGNQVVGDAYDLALHHSFQGNRGWAERFATAMQYGYKRQYADPAHDYAGADAHLKAFEEFGAEWWRLRCDRANAEALARAEQIQGEAKAALAAEEGNNDQWHLEWPEGDLGLVAQAMYASSIMPIKQFAIAGAIMLFSGVARKYNVFGDGLNQYMMIVGRTGRGKGEAKASLDKFVRWLIEQTQNPALFECFGFEQAVSEAGLHKALGDSPTLCAYQEEISGLLRSMTSAKQERYDHLRLFLTKVWGNSGRGKGVGRTAGAAKETSRGALEAPAFTFVGDTQPKFHKQLLGSGQIDTGFMPRTITFFHYGDRQRKKLENLNYKPDARLIAKLGEMFSYSRQNGTVVDIGFTPEALDRYGVIEDEATKYINQSSDADSTAELYNRYQQIIGRLAGMVAVGVNYTNPVITVAHLDWAQSVVDQGLQENLRIINDGEAGEGESIRIAALRRAVEAFVTGRFSESTLRNTYKLRNPQLMSCKHIVTRGYLYYRLRGQEDFKPEQNKGMLTAKDIITKTIADALDLGILRQCDIGEIGFINYKGSHDDLLTFGDNW